MGRDKLQPDEVRRLYDQHGPALVAYGCSFVWDAAVAEDTVHHVFLRLLSAGIARPDVPLAYVYRAVRNAALNARRSVQKDIPLETQRPVFDGHGQDREAALALQSALGELPEEQREVVIMRVWSGMTLEEVAAATGTPLNTAASRYRYALEKLRERLQPIHKER